MSIENGNPSAIETRLSVLEKEVRRYRIIATFCVAATFVISACGFMQLPGAHRAPSFEVVDNQGNLRAALGLDNSGQPALFFFNIQGANGPIRLLGTDGANLFIMSGPGNGTATITKVEGKLAK